jgi:holo-[acyl-carrier protein] synthase
MQGIGIDLIALSRMRETLERSGETFLRRVFSEREIRRGCRAKVPARYFASAFAIKEAVFKALILEWKRDVELRDIEVGRGAQGEPTVRLHGAVKEHAESRGCAGVLVSLSYETDLAVAMAWANGREPLAEGSRRF